VGGDGKGAQSAFQLETNHRAIFIYPDSMSNPTVSGQVAWFFEQNGVDVAFFDALVTYLEQNYCIDTDRIFALGVSSGAIMANMLGCFRGNVLRAIAPASGMTWSTTCTGDVAVMVFCGAQDTFNPCDDAKNGALSETNFWAPNNGCGTETTPSSVATICNDFQNCNAKDPVLICKHPGGHMWPTGGGDMMWSFFMGL
jgi:polyhydroxybutyrate depolymerase